MHNFGCCYHKTEDLKVSQQLEMTIYTRQMHLLHTILIQIQQASSVHSIYFFIKWLIFSGLRIQFVLVLNMTCFFKLCDLHWHFSKEKQHFSLKWHHSLYQYFKPNILSSKQVLFSDVTSGIYGLALISS